MTLQVGFMFHKYRTIDRQSALFLHRWQLFGVTAATTNLDQPFSAGEKKMYKKDCIWVAIH